MKFTVNGNEIEVYKEYTCIRIEGNFYYTVFVKFGDYEVEILEEYLGIALSNIDNIEKFKEFVDKHNEAISKAIRERIEIEEEADRELEKESFIKYCEEKAKEEDLRAKEEWKKNRGFGKFKIDIND